MSPSAERIPPVKVQVLKPALLEDRLVLTGNIAPWERVTLSAQVSGQIELQDAQQGQEITKGQELFRIDTKAVQARMDQVRAHLTLANQEYERAQRLVDQKVGSTQSLDSARAARDAAEAELRALRIQFNNSVIATPFDGVVDYVFKKQDEFVDVGAPLVRLVQVHKVKMAAGIPERDIACFKLGDAVRVFVDALADRVFPGTLYRLAPSADDATRTFAAEVELDNTQGLLRPGMVARAAFVRSSYPDALVVPIFALLTLGEQRCVAVEDAGVARLRPVEIGIVQGDSVQITQGLAPGERLIVVGQRDLREGDRVQVQEIIE